MGLNDVYDPIRDQILLIEAMPSVSKAYSMVLRVEKENPTFDSSYHSAHLIKFGGNSSGYKNTDGFGNRRTTSGNGEIRKEIDIVIIATRITIREILVFASMVNLIGTKQR